MTITLHDVFHILRIPIEGTPCIWKEGSDAYHVKTSKILDVTTEVVKNQFHYGGGYHVVKLLKHIGDGKVPTAASEAQIYLFCLLGYTLFTDTSGSRAKVGIIGGLTDVRSVDKKAWGAAALAHMYRELGKASRANSKKFSGCMTLLQSWIYEYFPSLRGVDSPTSRDVGAPLAGRWDGVRLAGGIHAFDYIEPHTPSRVLRQYGYRQTLMVARIPYTSASRRVDPKGYAVTYTKLADEYTDHGQWTAMAAYNTPSTVGADDGNVCPGYMEWYLLRTHPYIVPASLAAACDGVLSERVSI
ncbi:Protein MAIN-LIKE 1 [Linum grandiflorum]